MTAAPADLVRVRHLVLMSERLAPVGEQLADALGVRDPYSDPIAGEFGLRNEIFCLGDAFIEVCEPISDYAPGRRHLDRHGESGYMVIFQVGDLASAEQRVRERSVRIVWKGSGEGIAGIHLHPGDLPGSIVSLDQPDRPETWPWAGPDWTGRVGTGAPGELRAVRVGVRDPADAAARWAGALGRPADGATLAVDGCAVSFEADPHQRGLAQVHVAVPPAVRRGRPHVDICGVRFVLEDHRTTETAA